MTVELRDRSVGPGAATGSGEVVTCTGLRKRFGGVAALDGLDLHVGRGRVVGFLGPNGAGKSTTLRILLGLLRPDAGELRVLGEDPWAGDPATRGRIGYLPGELRLDDRLDVHATLTSWARLRGGVPAGAIESLCDRFALDRRRPVRTLSSGNRRKVGLVGALMADPDLLVLDEPTGGLDPLVQATFAEVLAERRAAGRSVLLSSHVLGEVQEVADDVVVIRAGRAVYAGGVEELTATARRRFAATFAGDPPVDALRAVTGVGDLVVEGARVRGTITGGPRPLLAALHDRPVTDLVLPEPDLEDAFLHLYEEPA